MTHGAGAPPTVTRRSEERSRPAGPKTARDAWPLAVLAAVFTLTQLVVIRPTLGMGWDEIVYTSQVTTHHPAAFFSAPRSRGVSLLVAPDAQGEVQAESGQQREVDPQQHGGVGPGRDWRGLFPTRLLVVAGAFFASLWVTLFYGPQAMPNYWVAVGALAAVGAFLRHREDPSSTGLLWTVVAGATLMALMRPTDAVWVTIPLLVLAAVWRRPRLLAAVVGGLLAGGVPWVIEAYASYGGLSERLAEASRIQGGLGLHMAVDDQLRSLGGRALCRPCTGEMPHPVITLWWFVLPVLAVLGLVVAVRAGRALRTAVPLACAATAALPYLFTIGYAAPRFLQPAYALLAIPVADALWHLVTAPRGRWSRWASRAIWRSN